MGAIVVIGASTGGPKVLREMFTGLPRLNLTILLVQHMPRYINERVRSSLDAATSMDVLLATDGMTPVPGQVVIAPSEVHMQVVNNQQIRLRRGPPVCHVCPAIDVLMESFAAAPGLNLTGVILTGMGSDGANGIRHIKSLGARTLAQDQRSSAVFGMPRRAIETGSVDFVGPPESIVKKIKSTAGVLRPRLAARAS